MPSEIDSHAEDEDRGLNSRLDEMIRRSLVVEDDAGQVERLQQYWGLQTKRRLQRRRLVLAATGAAATLLACSAFFSLQSDEIVERPPPGDRSSLFVKYVPGQPPEVTPADETDKSTRAVGRPPTAVERAVFLARTSRPVARQIMVSQPSIDDIVDRLVSEPEIDCLTLLSSSNLTLEQILPRLLEISRHAAHRDNSIVALKKLMGTGEWPKLVRASDDADTRASLILDLLTSESDTALRTFFELVNDRTTREEALAVAEQMPEPPTTRLFGLMDDEDKTIRLAAALTLGRINGPEVTEMLIARVNDKPSTSTEALLALLTCRGDRAEGFLAYAKTRPQLLGYYNNARLQWTVMDF